MKKMCLQGLLCLFLLMLLSPASGQQVKRPPLWGIAKMTYLVSDYALAQSYYGDFLGFDKAFSYPSPLGEVVAYKVNDRQFLEFVEDKAAREKERLVALTFETGDAEGMRSYLAAKGVAVPGEVTVDGAGNRVFTIHDPDGVPIEFLQWGENSLHRQNRGKNLSERRISPRIHHAGIYARRVQDNPVFYTEILGFRPAIRIPEESSQPLQIIYFQIPESAEMIEHYPTDTHNFAHPCFVAVDMQDVVYTLKERSRGEGVGRPMIGRGRKWLLNIANADGTKVEFVEMYLAR